MPSSPTFRNRLEKQAAGENLNTWGAPKLNTVIDLIDASLDGWTTKALTADVTLTSVNYSSDEARARVLKFTGTGAFTVTIPSVEKNYYIWNACTGALTITTGAGDTATVAVNEVATVICDASNVVKHVLRDFGAVVPITSGTPTLSTHLATKGYVDGLAFSAVDLPGQNEGTANQYIMSDGTSAGWATPTVADVIGAAPRASPTFTDGVTISSGGATVTGVSTFTGAVTVTGGFALSGVVDHTGGVSGNVVDMGAGTEMDVSAASYFKKTISTNTAVTFLGMVAGRGYAWTVLLTASAGAVLSLPASVKNNNGSNPLIQLGNGTHRLGFITDDGGATVDLMVLSQARS